MQLKRSLTTFHLAVNGRHKQKKHYSHGIRNEQAYQVQVSFVEWDEFARSGKLNVLRATDRVVSEQVTLSIYRLHAICSNKLFIQKPFLAIVYF